jgi:hypothetical protein
MVTLRSALAFVAFLSGCSAVNDPSGYIGPPPELPLLRVVHAARDTAPVNVLVDGTLAFEDAIAFQGASEDATLPSGLVTIEVVQADTGELLLQEDFELARGRRYTLAVYGDVTPPEMYPERTRALLLLPDDVRPFDIENEIRVVVTHLASPVVEGNLVAVGPVGTPPAVLARRFGFGVVAQPNPLPAPPGPFTVGFDAGANDSVDFYFELPSLVGGTYANVFVVCDDAGNPFLLVNTRGGTRAIIEPSPPPSGS